MKMNVRKKIMLLSAGTIVITSGVVFGKDSFEDKVKVEDVVEVQEKVENTEENIDVQEKVEDTEISIHGVNGHLDENEIVGMSLSDVNIPKEQGVPNKVGIDAKDNSVSKSKFPTIPGFIEEDAYIYGILPNELQTEIYLMDMGDSYELRTGSEVLYDDVAKSYVDIILEYYKDKKYTSEVSGLSAVFKINK